MAWTAPRTWVTGELVTSSLLNTHLRDNLIAVLPVGTFIYRAANYSSVETAVEGRWLQANGVAVSRTTYSVLFNYLNGLSPALPFGAGNGVTTFTLPDMRSRIPLGQADPTGPALINGLGNSDARSAAARNISHHHFMINILVAGGQLPGGSGGWDPGNQATTGDGNNQDYPAFLIGGSYFIKYTS